MKALHIIKSISGVLMILFCQLAFCKPGTVPIDTLYSIKIEVSYELSQPGDTLILHFGPQDSYLQKVCDSYISIVDQSGKATFNIAQPYPYGYFSIAKTKSSIKNDNLTIADNLFWESSDDISINIKHPKEIKNREYIYNTTFTGVNARKYQTIYETRKRKDQIIKEQLKERKILSSGKPYKDRRLDFSISDDTVWVDKMLAILDSSKSQISPFAYQVLKVDIIMTDYESLRTKLAAAGQYWNFDLAVKDSLSKSLMNTFIPIKDLEVDQNALVASTLFSKFYGELFKTIGLLAPKYEEIEVVRNIVTHTNGIVREAILCNYLDQIGLSSENKSAYLYAQDYLSHNYYQDFFRHIKSKSSHNVNNYVFKDMNGNDVALSDFNGKLVLIDVWFTGCGGCIWYRNEILSKIEEEYKDDNRFQIVSISTDKNESVWKKSVALNTYTDPHALNLYSGGLGMFHPFFRDLGTIVAPTPVLIDRQGDVIDNDSFRLRDLGLLRELIKKNL